MKRFVTWSMVCVALLAVSGDSPLLLAEGEANITLPTRTVVTVSDSVPTEVTTTEVITTIDPGVWYVIRSEKPLFVLDSPQGSVTIVSGATVVDGVFAGSDGVSETKVFDSSQFTYLIQGTEPCTTELILIPEGVTDRQSIERHTLTVSGEGPQPPPDEDEEPDVPDEPVDPPVVESFRVIFVKESGATLNSAQSAIPAAKVIRDYLQAKTTAEGGVSGFREYDPDQSVVNEIESMTALWAAVQPKLLPAPCLVIEVNGHATVMPFPADVDECMTTLKEFGGE